MCEGPGPLRASHIIPRFVFEWLRTTSATGHIRLGEEPNVRAQDGWKPKLLCPTCEGTFSKWEKTFAEQIFVPLHTGTQARLPYGPWLLKFSVSISWRILTAFKLIGGLNGFPPQSVSAAENALKTWREFLLGQRAHPAQHEQHMMPVSMLESTDDPALPPNFNRYMHRAVDMYVAYNGANTITYAKLGRIVLFGFISMSHPKRWQGTKVHVRTGTLGADTYHLPGSIFEFFIDQARKMEQSQSRISERQRAVIHDAYEQNIDRLADSEVFQAMQQDVMMFGEAAFLREDS
jgi:hypothetical protein